MKSFWKRAPDWESFFSEARDSSSRPNAMKAVGYGTVAADMIPHPEFSLAEIRAFARVAFRFASMVLEEKGTRR